MIPWLRGKALVWDATIRDTLAPSYVSQCARTAGAAAQLAEDSKASKYCAILTTHHYVTVAIETLGTFGQEACTFIAELGRRLRRSSCDPKATLYLYQRLSIALQRGNTAAILGSLPKMFDFNLS